MQEATALPKMLITSRPLSALVLRSLAAGRTYEIRSDADMLAGASHICDLDLREFFQVGGATTISRCHFKITPIADEGYVIYDLHSLNGTKVNGCPLKPGEPWFLRSGDIITLAGNEQLSIEVSSDPLCDTQVSPWGDPFDHAHNADGPSRGLLHLSSNGQFVVDGTPLALSYLTPLEQRLLEYLYERAGRVCTYDEIIAGVWGYTYYDKVQNNSVAKLASNLRRKLDLISDGAGNRHIRTILGRGITCMPA